MLLGHCLIVGAARADERPNLLIFTIDTMRADHVGAAGYARDTTPHIDAAAREGMFFEEAVATYSHTLPAFVSMMTGIVASIS